MSDAVIQLQGVSKWYGAHQVLRDCSLDVGTGEVVVVCGPSGSGKSTLIKCVNALEPVQAGSIAVAGIRLGQKGVNLPKLRARVGMVFQHFELFPHMSVLANLLLGQRKVLGRTTAQATAKANALLERVGMGGFAAKYPGQLSAASSSASPSPAPWRWTRSSCCSTNPPPRSTPRWSARCWTSWWSLPPAA